MKAVLEFNYPDDEHALKYAVKGEEYYKALVSIDEVVANPLQFGDRADMLDRIKFILDGVLDE
jgi:hypothetical protein